MSDPNHEDGAICSTPKPPSNIDSVILHLSFLHEIKVKYCHVFAVASPKVIAMIEYVIRKTPSLKAVTFDSTEFADGTRLRVYYSPIDHRREIVMSERPKFARRPCDCPVCASFDWTKPPTGDLYDLHNLQMLKRRFQYYASLSDDSLMDALHELIKVEKKLNEFVASIDAGYENVRHRQNTLDRYAKV
jgi:hypothetical protein